MDQRQVMSPSEEGQGQHVGQGGYRDALHQQEVRAQEMMQSDQGVVRGRMLREQAVDGSVRTMIEWTRQEQQFVETTELSRIVIKRMLEQHQDVTSDVQALAMELENVVNQLRITFGHLNQKMMSRDLEVRKTVEAIVGQMEVDEQNRRKITQFIEEDIIKRVLEVERHISWKPDFDRWTTTTSNRCASMEKEFMDLQTATNYGLHILQERVDELARTVKDRGIVQSQQYVELIG